MFESVVRGGVCAVAVLLAGCGSLEAVGENASEIVSDDITGVPGCPGAWQLADSYDGLVGQYLRGDLTALKSGDLLTLEILSLAHEPNSIRDEGNYLASVFGSAVQGGTYVAIESNPLIGAFLILTSSAPRAPQSLYAVIGQRRSVAGKISSLCLSAASQDSGGPFQLNRIGF